MMLILITFILVEVLTRAIRQEKEMKAVQLEKKGWNFPRMHRIQDLNVHLQKNENGPLSYTTHNN